MISSDAHRIVRRLQAIAEQQRQLNSERAALVAKLPDGRTEGASMDVYVRGEGQDYDVSIRELRLYVSEHVIAKCRVRRHRKRSAKIVPKLQPKKPRNQEQA